MMALLVGDEHALSAILFIGLSLRLLREHG
jgi:hypothetical protein